ncbi:hypothetical protein TSOC_005763 [Tetrabaena socialis]|uniref:CCHC-type domain-containing protein n=1 Tax=Tetrabaena socialis TaxID=47790 RepID=A0A2J8A5D8_9CHLO|nr:hypothetical protein TSOC_005763 [Tetrabaena socialis]|eukprot:PNH07734.1 hypothetical protein TSOC_005763 [Tetrabaena socialis]
MMIPEADEEFDAESQPHMHGPGTAARTAEQPANSPEATELGADRCPSGAGPSTRPLQMPVQAAAQPQEHLDQPPRPSPGQQQGLGGDTDSDDDKVLLPPSKRRRLPCPNVGGHGAATGVTSGDEGAGTGANGAAGKEPRTPAAASRRKSAKAAAAQGQSQPGGGGGRPRRKTAVPERYRGGGADAGEAEDSEDRNPAGGGAAAAPAAEGGAGVGSDVLAAPVVRRREPVAGRGSDSDTGNADAAAPPGVATPPRSCKRRASQGDEGADAGRPRSNGRRRRLCRVSLVPRAGPGLDGGSGGAGGGEGELEDSDADADGAAAAVGAGGTGNAGPDEPAGRGTRRRACQPRAALSPWVLRRRVQQRLQSATKGVGPINLAGSDDDAADGGDGRDDAADSGDGEPGLHGAFGAAGAHGTGAYGTGACGDGGGAGRRRVRQLMHPGLLPGGEAGADVEVAALLGGGGAVTRSHQAGVAAAGAARGGGNDGEGSPDEGESDDDSFIDDGPLQEEEGSASDEEDVEAEARRGGKKRQRQPGEAAGAVGGGGVGLGPPVPIAGHIDPDPLNNFRTWLIGLLAELLGLRLGAEGDDPKEKEQLRLNRSAAARSSTVSFHWVTADNKLGLRRLLQRYPGMLIGGRPPWKHYGGRGGAAAREDALGGGEEEEEDSDTDEERRRCSICQRRDHWLHPLQLLGAPVDVGDRRDADAAPPPLLWAGSHCCDRVLLYHALCHLKERLRSALKKRLKHVLRWRLHAYDSRPPGGEAFMLPNSVREAAFKWVMDNDDKFLTAMWCRYKDLVDAATALSFTENKRKRVRPGYRVAKAIRKLHDSVDGAESDIEGVPQVEEEEGEEEEGQEEEEEGEEGEEDEGGTEEEEEGEDGNAAEAEGGGKEEKTSGSVGARGCGGGGDGDNDSGDTGGGGGGGGGGHPSRRRRCRRSRVVSEDGEDASEQGRAGLLGGGGGRPSRRRRCRRSRVVSEDGEDGGGQGRAGLPNGCGSGGGGGHTRGAAAAAHCRTSPVAGGSPAEEHAACFSGGCASPLAGGSGQPTGALEGAANWRCADAAAEAAAKAAAAAVARVTSAIAQAVAAADVAKHAAAAAGWPPPASSGGSLQATLAGLLGPLHHMLGLQPPLQSCSTPAPGALAQHPGEGPAAMEAPSGTTPGQPMQPLWPQSDYPREEPAPQQQQPAAALPLAQAATSAAAAHTPADQAAPIALPQPQPTQAFGVPALQPTQLYGPLGAVQNGGGGGGGTPGLAQRLNGMSAAAVAQGQVQQLRPEAAQPTPSPSQQQPPRAGVDAHVKPWNIKGNECFRCGQLGHWASYCPNPRRQW